MRSIPSTLGGSQHGYVGVILSLVTYDNLALIQPSIALIYPGIFNVVHPTTQYGIVLDKTLHNKEVRTFQSYQLIQRALIQKELEAVEDKYLSNLRNRITEQVPSDIRYLVLHLF